MTTNGATTSIAGASASRIFNQVIQHRLTACSNVHDVFEMCFHCDKYAAINIIHPAAQNRINARASIGATITSQMYRHSKPRWNRITPAMARAMMYGFIF